MPYSFICISGALAGEFSTTALGFALGIGSAVTYASYSVVSPFALKHYLRLLATCRNLYGKMMVLSVTNCCKCRIIGLL